MCSQHENLPPDHRAVCSALQYDQDVVTWSPQGRIHQIEYAMEAVKQGSAVVGLKVSDVDSDVPVLRARAAQTDA